VAGEDQTRPSPIPDARFPAPDPLADEPGPHEAPGTTRHDLPEPRAPLGGIPSSPFAPRRGTSDPPQSRAPLGGILLPVLILLALLAWAASGPRVAADATLPAGNPTAIGSTASAPCHDHTAPIDAVHPTGRIAAIAPIDSTGQMVRSAERSAVPAEDQNSENEPRSAVFDDPGLPDEVSSQDGGIDDYGSVNLGLMGWSTAFRRKMAGAGLVPGT
jgi:hypothetical protein